MNDFGYKRLAIVAVRAAVDIMDNSDPADRTDEEGELVVEFLALVDAAVAGDHDAQDLIREAVPEWVALHA